MVTVREVWRYDPMPITPPDLITIPDLDSYTTYGLHPRPSFTQNQMVWVRGIRAGEIVRGRIRGLAWTHIVDMWIVDFGGPISKDYPWSAVSIAHGMILTPASATDAMVAFARAVQ